MFEFSQSNVWHWSVCVFLKTFLGSCAGKTRSGVTHVDSFIVLIGADELHSSVHMHLILCGSEMAAKCLISTHVPKLM